MIKASTFENSHLLWPVLLVSVMLLIVFIWKEWNTTKPKQFYLNNLIALITIASLAMLVLKPLKIRQNQARVGVVLTDNFKKQQLDSIKKINKEIRLISYTENQVLTKNLDSLSKTYILGDGVEPYDFWQFENRSVNYLGTDEPKGISQIKFNKESVLGADLVVNGIYRKAKAKHKLILQDGNGIGIDSLVLAESELQNFELSTATKAVGKFVFRIVEKDAAGLQIASDPLAFKVINNQKVKVLLINRFPTFESKYVKNYLAEMGHEVVVRSQLTKGRYKFEYFNTKRTPIYALNQAALMNFDLLIIDATSFKNIPRSASVFLEKAIANDGLGLFIQPDASLFSINSKQFSFKFNSDAKDKVKLPEFPKLTLDKFPYVFLENDGLEKIHEAKNKILTGYKRIQNGRIGTTIIQNTFQLKLKGQTKAYRQFWSKIINKLSKKKEQSVHWRVDDFFPLAHRPFEFELQSKIIEPQVKNQDGRYISLRQNIDIPTLWSGTSYPLKEHWNQIQLNNSVDRALDFYVVDSLSWLSLRTNILQKRNMRFFKKEAEDQIIPSFSGPLNLLLFFIIGLLGFSYLWLHPKLFQS